MTLSYNEKMKEYNGRNITIMACSQCNINCKHCYISYDGNYEPDELKNISHELQKKYAININGTELLTNIKYLETLKEVNQPFFMSNGLAIYKHPEIIDEIKKYGIKSISLSYHFGIQDNISVMSPDNIETVIKLLKENEIQARLLTTITKKNYKNIVEMCDKAYELGVRGIKFTNFLSQGNAVNIENEYILSKEEKQYALTLIDIARQKYDVDELLIERCGSFGRNMSSEKNKFVCDAINDSVTIAPNKKVYPCVFLTKPGYEIGEYKEGKIYIYNCLDNNGKLCLADEICNQKKKIRIRKEGKL